MFTKTWYNDEKRNWNSNSTWKVKNYTDYGPQKKSLIETNDIQEGKNIGSLFDKSNAKNEFDSK